MLWPKVRSAMQLYGPDMIKRLLWNREFKGSRWNCLLDTPDDPVYAPIQKYALNGSILDLGCGSGNTANELREDVYREYTGVDISDAAIAIAAARAMEKGIAHKTHFLHSDIFKYVPDKKYRVILFRDSIYYLPVTRIKPELERYTDYLDEKGVFIVRMWDASRRGIVKIFEDNFEIVEKCESEKPAALVVVFRPRRLS